MDRAQWATTTELELERRSAATELERRTAATGWSGDGNDGKISQSELNKCVNSKCALV